MDKNFIRMKPGRCASILLGPVAFLDISLQRIVTSALEKKDRCDALCRFDERVTLLVRTVCPRSVSSYIEVEYAVSFRAHVHESALFQASHFGGN